MQGKTMVLLAVLVTVFVAAARVSGETEESANHPGEIKPVMSHGPRKFTCMFFPGIGNDWPELDVPEHLRASHHKFMRKEYDDMWGHELAAKLKHKCEELWFYDTDTSYRAWDDASLAREFDRAIDTQKPHVVFAHGFSNLVLANCKHLKLKSCAHLGKKLDWFGLAAPLRGTEVANVMPALCPKLVGHKVFAGGNDCVEMPGTHPLRYEVSAAWQSMVPSKVPHWVYKTAENDMTGSMCGLAATDYTQAMLTADATPFGMIAKAMSTYKPKGLTSRNARHRPDPDDWKTRNVRTSPAVPKTGNDGVVALSSCAVRSMKKYKKDPAHKFYALDGNHDFATASKGDDHNHLSRQPVMWITRMVDHVRKGNKFPPRFAEVHEADAAVDETLSAEETEEVEAAAAAEADAEIAEESEAAADEVADEFEAAAEGESESEAAAEGEAEADSESEAAVDAEAESEAEAEVAAAAELTTAELDADEAEEEAEDEAEELAEQHDEAMDDAAEDALEEATERDEAIAQATDHAQELAP